MYRVDEQILSKYGIDYTKVLDEDVSKSKVMRAYTLQDTGKNLVQFIVRTQKCAEMCNYTECKLGNSTYYVFIQVTERTGKSRIKLNGKDVPLVMAVA